MVIDDSITRVEIDDDGEGPTFKEPTVEVEAQGIEMEGLTPEKELTPVNSRSSSPLIPPEVHPLISWNDEVSTSNHQEWLKIIQKVT